MPRQRRGGDRGGNGRPPPRPRPGPATRPARGRRAHWYLTDTQWQLPTRAGWNRRWLHTAAPCKGAAGPVTRLHPRPGPDAGPAEAARRPAYRLADYLDQHGRRHRAETFPPAGFWAAAGRCAPADRWAALGEAAHDRGQYRHAAQLWKNAAERGDPRTVARLVNMLHEVLPADHHAPQLAAAASLDDPAGVAVLLDSLRKAGLAEQMAALATRDPAAAVALDDPGAVARLLDSLRKAGLADQVAALATRAAAAVALGKPGAVAVLLDSLREAGLAEQRAALATRARGRRRPDDRDAVAWLPDSLRVAGLADQTAALATRAAPAVALDDPTPWPGCWTACGRRAWPTR